MWFNLYFDSFIVGLVICLFDGNLVGGILSEDLCCLVYCCCWNCFGDSLGCIVVEFDGFVFVFEVG